MINIIFPQYIEKAITTLENNGHLAFCVGGCVRDSLLGNTPADWDIATSALPQETLACFSSFHTIETGLRHGTVSVRIDGQTVEITTFRTDGDYEDYRKPSSVSFTSDVETDLARRDFTVNAMAFHPEKGLIDPFGGLTDLKNKILRCVGNPHDRFSEDALRILRYVRFCAQLDFKPSPETYAAAIEKRNLLQNISYERIQTEIIKALIASHAKSAFQKNAEILFEVLPELAPMQNCLQETSYHCYGVWEHTLTAIENSLPTPVVRFALLFHDSGKPIVKTKDDSDIAHFYGHAAVSVELSKAAMKRLRFSKDFQAEVLFLVKHHDHALPFKNIRIKRLMAELGEESFSNLLAVIYADISAQAPHLFTERLSLLSQTATTAEEMIRNRTCLSLKNLAVTGKDLKLLGFPEGKAIGGTLNMLLELVLHEQTPNERKRLLKTAEKHFNKMKSKGKF